MKSTYTVWALEKNGTFHKRKFILSYGMSMDPNRQAAIQYYDKVINPLRLGDRLLWCIARFQNFYCRESKIVIENYNGNV